MHIILWEIEFLHKRNLLFTQSPTKLLLQISNITSIPINDKIPNIFIQQKKVPIPKTNPIPFQSPAAYKLTVEFPFENNQILDDSPSTVKITNIFADTSAQTNLQAQFTFISMAHYVSNFRMELAMCDLLSHLNVSQTVTLPPNEAVTVNVSFPLRLYNQHKEVQCEGEFLSSNYIFKLLLF